MQRLSHFTALLFPILMSRTHRSEPTSGCWMRTPRHKLAERGLEPAAFDIRESGHLPVKPASNRRAIPPNAWDDLTVSYWRGQKWARKR